MAENVQPNANAPATKLPQARQFFVDLNSELNRRKGEFARLLPKYLTPERFMTVAYQAVTRTPALQRCSIASILKSVMEAAEAGLMIGGPLKQGHLVPFGDQAQFIPDFRGLAHLAYQAGGVSRIQAQVVHKNDFFEVELGSDPRLVHKPAASGRGDSVAYYAVARLANGESMFEVMERSEVELIRERSKAARSGPWVTDFDEMAKKTVFKRLEKWLPKTDGQAADRLARAIEQDNAATGLEDAIDTTSTKVPDDLLPSDIEREMRDAAGPPNGQQVSNGLGEDGKIEVKVDRTPPDELISIPQQNALVDAMKSAKMTDDEVIAFLKPYGATSTDELKNKDYTVALTAVINRKKTK